MASAIQNLQQAIEKDPGYAPAHAELAIMLHRYCFFRVFAAAGSSMQKPRQPRLRSVEIDDRLAEAHTALGAVNYQLEWNFLEAEKAFKRAIELNPNSSRTLNYYAWMLGETGRFEEAMVPAHRAQELDPLSAPGQRLGS